MSTSSSLAENRPGAGSPRSLEALRPAVAYHRQHPSAPRRQLSSAPGSVAQQCRGLRRALQAPWPKRQDTACCWCGHVTKEGMLAGRKVRKHLVMPLLTFEG